MGITEKFDELLSTLNSDPARQPPHDARAPPPDHGTIVHIPAGSHIEVRLTPLDSRAPAYTAFVAQQLSGRRLTFPGVTSMALDPFKPYMYVNRPGVSTMKKKLDV